MITDQEKIACIDKQLELAARCETFQVKKVKYRWQENPSFDVEATLDDDKGIRVNISVQAPSLVEVIDEAYTRVRRVLDAFPAVDSQKVIAHQPPAPAKSFAEEIDDEIPF